MSFTGSIPVGKHLARLAAAGLKRCTLELGGHGPVVVRSDADLAHAVDATTTIKYRNAGQVCIAPNRFYVHESLHESFVGRFTDYVETLRVGNGLDDDVDMGPMANTRRLDAMETFVTDAIEIGARLVAGGERLHDRVCFFAPAVPADVPDSAAIMNEETFGPVAPMTWFSDDDEVLARANALPCGLAAYVFTRSVRASDHFSRRLEAGCIGINAMTAAQPDTPLGGVKESGYGYEGGTVGLEAYLHQKLNDVDMRQD